MKKVLLSVAVVAAFGMVSCGGPSVCDCVEGRAEMREKLKEAGDDEDKVKEIEEEYKSLKEDCEAMMEEAKDDEEKQKELAKEAEECEK